ncbi:hypothetical protein PR370_15820 [Mycobacterium marinum]|uniref:hypothetical protein n=1 Tax=Mycobacterium marinum TaxID=1781 RepID=UPI00235989A8|nr:hypothetical protein [Mycobacterium marinum]MDC8982552.1 hypothetical protein [Mycobacterium marinum]MDC8999066.1 hypothetical protein [Mycobacterium marinum]MDC9011512.1 hypothetical protein [Mycobacterium marinum]
MMYLVTPGQLLWTDVAGLSPQKILAMGGSLEAIDDWKPSERPVWDSDFQIALRYGVPVSKGIIVEAIHILDKERPGELRKVHEAAKRAGQHPQIKATDDFIDKYLAPGWKQQGEDLDRRVDESFAETLREAEEDARKLLDERVKPELVAHWRSIGGFVPK